MKLNWDKWLYGLFSGFIGGGAGSAGAALSACVIAPDAFNLAAKLGHTLELAGSTFLISGLVTALAYLRQSPLPPPNDPQS
jgi:hypothetical protein